MKPLKDRWKIIGAGAALATLGIAGAGFSGASDGLSLPDAITLNDRVPITEAAPEPPARGFEIVTAPLAGDSLDSPFNSSASASLQSIDSASFDSPDANLVPRSAPAPEAPAPFIGSPDSVSFDSPDTFVAPQNSQAPAFTYGSPDSVSFDSPDTFVAPQNSQAPAFTYGSPDSVSFDSPDTYVAPGNSWTPAPSYGGQDSYSFDSYSFDSASFSS